MENKMFCRYCGKQIPNDSIFCQHCGKSVDVVMDNSSTNVDVKEEKVNALKIEIIKSSDNKNDEKAKKFVSGFIKEIALITLFVGIAYAGKVLLYIIFILSNQPPLVTEERQEAFNDAIFKLKYPNGLPPIEQYLEGSYDKEKYPTVYNFSCGIPLAELGVGEYKYDKEATEMSDYENLNDFRKCALERHAENASKILFWTLLIGIPLLRYIILLFKWLISETNPQQSPKALSVQKKLKGYQ